MEAGAHGQVSARELRNFGLVLGALFAAFFGLLPWIRHHRLAYWPWILTAALWLAALARPRSLAQLHRWWTRLGETLGWFNTRVILTAIFLVVVTPLGFLMRLFGRDRMQRGFARTSSSYRVPSRQRPPASMEKPF